MCTPAGLALFVAGGNRLDGDAGGVGRQAECAFESFLLGSFNHGRARGGAGIFQPAAHRAPVDGRAFATVTVFEAIERQALQMFLGDDVCEHRRCSQRARERLLRHGRRLDGDFLLGIDRAVLHASNHQPAMPATLPRQLVALLEANALGLAVAYQVVEEWVGNLDANFRNIGFAQVATPGRLLLGSRITRAVRTRASPGVGRDRLLGKSP